MYKRFVKRGLGFFLSFIGLLLLWPVLLIIAVAIKIDSPGPVFFCQKRVGRGQKQFVIIKFRTMRADTPKDVPTHLLQNPAASITRVGRLLRRLSLDELPQLINILRGHMSIIGPRPALWNQYDLVAARQAGGANGLRPGLTGYAQINGRDELPIERKAELDAYYARHLSFGFDAKIFFTTIFKVFVGSGVKEGTQS